MHVLVPGEVIEVPVTAGHHEARWVGEGAAATAAARRSAEMLGPLLVELEMVVGRQSAASRTHEVLGKHAGGQPPGLRLGAIERRRAERVYPQPPGKARFVDTPRVSD